MELDQLVDTALRHRPRYLGTRSEERRDEASLVLAEMRAKLDALLDRNEVPGARREVLHDLAARIDNAAAHLASGAHLTGALSASHRPTESEWLSRLGSDLEAMQEAADAPDLMAHLARIALRELGGDACMVSFLDRDRDSLRDVAGASSDNRRLNLVAQEHPLKRYPLTRDVIASGRPVEVSGNDYGADPAERAFLSELGFMRVLLCPLVIAGETLGTIEVYRHKDVPFESHAWARLSTLMQFTAGPFSSIRMAEQLRDHYTKTLEVLTSALEVRDMQTHDHTGRIRELATALADAMRLSPEDKTSVRLGAMLHDVGKLGVPDSILLKPGPLTEEEWAIMRRHPEIGERMLSSFDFLAPALPVVRHHHERWDGRGYPDGLAEGQIPLAARIVAVCDAFDAMTSDRPYRKATSAEAACEELVACAGAQFDPLCVAVLVNLVKDTAGRAIDERSIVRYAS